MNIFVGNLSFDATQGDVKKLFEGFGNVAYALIVMEKEKRAPKSRGFGFVQMPDEQQALAAIAALNGKEFMGRALNVNPARPNPTGIVLPKPIKEGAKTETQAASELKKKMQPKARAQAEQYPREETEPKKAWFSPVFNKPGKYKGGRRTRSYMKQHGLTVMEDTKPRRKSQDNPMRWRKRKDQLKPWQKSLGGHKPWNKVKEGVRSWKKTGGESKPWRRSESGFKSWEKPEGESRPWKKSEKGFKPWKKPAGEAKHWSKSSERPQESRLNPSTSSFDKLRTVRRRCRKRSRTGSREWWAQSNQRPEKTGRL